VIEILAGTLIESHEVARADRFSDEVYKMQSLISKRRFNLKRLDRQLAVTSESSSDRSKSSLSVNGTG